MNGEWRGHGDRNKPNDGDNEQTSGPRHAQLRVSHDHEIPVDGDGEYRQS